VLSHEGIQQGDDLLLLAAGQFCGCLESLAEFAAWVSDPARLWLAENLFNRDAEDTGKWKQELGFGDLTGALPIKNGGVIGIELASQFANGQPGLLA
jgi:hypothetical protein